MPKRDRWSSDDEGDEVVNDDGHVESNRSLMMSATSSSSSRMPSPAPTEEIIPVASTNTTQAALSSSSSSSSSYRTHNSLLQGCRSIYTSYERLSHLDEGSYGVVWKAKCLRTNDVVAIKQIKFDNELTKDGFPISALREISVLLSLSHTNIIPVYEMVIGSTPDKVFMVMECMECDLQTAMTTRHQSSQSNSQSSQQQQQPFAQSEIKCMMHQLLLAVSHVHNHWYMHRDVKTSNILIHNSGRLALCDFGLARKYVLPINTNRAMTSMVVTLWYRSIELLFGEVFYGPEIDLWSVGCVFGELLCKDAILKGNGELDVSAVSLIRGEICHFHANVHDIYIYIYIYIPRYSSLIDSCHFRIVKIYHSQQIQKIFQLLGTPTDANWPQFSSLPNAGTFKWKSRDSTELSKRFLATTNNFTTSGAQSYLDRNGFDLLQRMLTLNPRDRITALDALDHDYFKEGVGMRTPDFFT